MSEVIFTPVDVPPIPQKEDILKHFEELDFYVWWGEETLLGLKENNNPLGKPQNFTARAWHYYPMLVNWIQSYIPCDDFYYIRIARAKHAIPPHIDGNAVNPTHKHHLAITQEALDQILENEPVGYRFIIKGSRDKLYMCDEYDYTRDMTWQEKRYCTVPEDTDCFLINNQTQPHGVDEDEEDRLVGFILGKVNPERHKELLDRSVEKYKDYVQYA
jgi:hypothetical protein